MSHPAADIAATLSLLSVGDVVTVNAGGKLRSVRVTEIRDGYIFTASGAVRPGHIAGGCIRVAPWGVTFQPTMQQQAHTVASLTRHAVCAFRAAS